MTWAILCLAWVMLAIVSLEHSSFMSENKQDEFEAESSTSIDEEAQILASTHSQPATTADVPLEAGPPTAENTLPPEAQGEANGGPLGCCLGIMVGLLLSLSLAIL